jgi:hypothetical protein
MILLIIAIVVAILIASMIKKTAKLTGKAVGKVATAPLRAAEALKPTANAPKKNFEGGVRWTEPMINQLTPGAQLAFKLVIFGGTLLVLFLIVRSCAS